MWIKPRRFNTIHYGSLTHWERQNRASPDGGWADFEVLRYTGKNLRPAYLLVYDRHFVIAQSDDYDALLASEWKYATEKLPVLARSAQPPLTNTKQREKWLYKRVEAIVQSILAKVKMRSTSATVQQLVPASPAPISVTAAAMQAADEDDWESADEDDAISPTAGSAGASASAAGTLERSVASSKPDTPTQVARSPSPASPRPDASPQFTTSAVTTLATNTVPKMPRDASMGAITSASASLGAPGAKTADGVVSCGPEETPASRERSRSNSTPPLPLPALETSEAAETQGAPGASCSAATSPVPPRHNTSEHNLHTSISMDGQKLRSKGSLPPSPGVPRAASVTPSTQTKGTAAAAAAATQSDDEARPPLLSAMPRQRGNLSLMSSPAPARKQDENEYFCSPPSASNGSVTDTASGLIHRIAKRSKEKEQDKQDKKPMSQHCAAVLAATERFYSKVEPESTDQDGQQPALGRTRSNSTGTMVASSAGTLSKRKAAAAAAAAAAPASDANKSKDGKTNMQKGVEAAKQGAEVMKKVGLQVYAKLRTVPLFNSYVEPWVEAFREECPTSEQRTRKRIVLCCVGLTLLLTIVNLSNSFFFSLELLLLNAAVVEAIKNRVALVKYFAKAKLSHSTERGRKRFLRTWHKARHRDKDNQTPPVTPSSTAPPPQQPQAGAESSSDSSEDEILDVLLSDAEN